MRTKGILGEPIRVKPVQWAAMIFRDPSVVWYERFGAQLSEGVW
ncbi:MAG: hypothetical protein Hyperionvirus21_5 [Hyperionvirus sp.]|uniref:Uncharacterized protein n=1 Tax=Hyperionvirus sp. TaxID=2487770 RepID=A0A3G5ADC5_9VIRU|nr:MAG: hypothetical protein Hyperionvirus21_5 [Hyperionvirus sp.]